MGGYTGTLPGAGSTYLIVGGIVLIAVLIVGYSYFKNKKA